MAIFRSNFVFQLRRGDDIAATISYLNRLIAETTEANLYVTSFTAKLDAYDGDARPTSMPAIRRRWSCAAKNGCALKREALVVGMFADVEYPVSRFALQPGDVLVMYTDGVIEAENESGEEYSLARLGAGGAWRDGTCRPPTCRQP